jgi:hypothetical protein
MSALICGAYSIHKEERKSFSAIKHLLSAHFVKAYEFYDQLIIICDNTIIKMKNLIDQVIAFFQFYLPTIRDSDTTLEKQQHETNISNLIKQIHSILLNLLERIAFYRVKGNLNQLKNIPEVITVRFNYNDLNHYENLIKVLKGGKKTNKSLLELELDQTAGRIKNTFDMIMDYIGKLVVGQSNPVKIFTLSLIDNDYRIRKMFAKRDDKDEMKRLFAEHEKRLITCDTEGKTCYAIKFYNNTSSNARVIIKTIVGFKFTTETFRQNNLFPKSYVDSQKVFPESYVDNQKNQSKEGSQNSSMSKKRTFDELNNDENKHPNIINNIQKEAVYYYTPDRNQSIEEEEKEGMVNKRRKTTTAAANKKSKLTLETPQTGEVVDKNITSELIEETKSDADATTSDLGAIQGKNMYAFLLFMMIIIII